MASNQKKIVIDLLRHGQPEGGEVLRGRIDHPLNDLGWQQMRRAVNLGEEKTEPSFTPAWTHIVSSPLQRCRHFAEHVAQQTGLELRVDANWQEIDYGDWDGMLLSEWRLQAAAQFKEFRSDLSKLAPPNGEDYLTFRDRILKAWQSIAELPDGSHVLIVTHGGVLRVVLPTVLGMPLNRSYPLLIPFACFSRVIVEVTEEHSNASLLFHNAAEYRGS